MNFDKEKIRMLSEKLGAFSSGLNSDEQALLAAMLRLSGLAIGQRRPANITDASGRPDIAQAFEDALTVGSGSTLVPSQRRPVTIDVPPVTVAVGTPISVATTIDPDPVTVDLPV